MSTYMFDAGRRVTDRTFLDDLCGVLHPQAPGKGEDNQRAARSVELVLEAAGRLMDLGSRVVQEHRQAYTRHRQALFDNRRGIILIGLTDANVLVEHAIADAIVLRAHLHLSIGMRV